MDNVVLSTKDDLREMLRHIEESIEIIRDQEFERKKQEDQSGYTRKVLMGEIKPESGWWRTNPEGSLQMMRKKVMLALRHNQRLIFDAKELTELKVKLY